MPVKFGPDGFTSAALRRYLQNKPPQSDEVNAAGSPSPRGSRVAGTLLTIAFVIGGAYYLARGNYSPAVYTAPGKIMNKREAAHIDGASQKIIEILIKEPTGNHYRVEFECDDNTWNAFENNQEVIVHYSGNATETKIIMLEPGPAPIEL